MSVVSAFERDLSFGLKSVGFRIKIPDCSRSIKPFDYVVALPGRCGLRFVAVEAKTARGWSLNKRSDWKPQQRDALAYLSNIDRWAAWVAILFKDAPKMKRGPCGRILDSRMRRIAIMVPWHELVQHESGTSFRPCPLSDWDAYRLVRDNVNGRYYWKIPECHPLTTFGVTTAYSLRRNNRRYTK